MHIEKLKQDKIDQENRIKRKKAHKQAKKISLEKKGEEERLAKVLLGSAQPLEDIVSLEIKEFTP